MREAGLILGASPLPCSWRPVGRALYIVSDSSLPTRVQSLHLRALHVHSEQADQSRVRILAMELHFPYTSHAWQGNFMEHFFFS